MFKFKVPIVAWLFIKHQFMNIVKVSALLVVFSWSFLPTVTHSEPGDFDLSIYGAQSWSGSGEEYPGDNFWEHYYWNNISGANDLNNNVTHTGRDYGVNPTQHGGVEVEHGKVMSYGYGKVQQVQGCNTVSINQLLDSGEKVTFNLLHMNPIHIRANDFISKYHLLGTEGGMGGDPCRNNAYGHHLHVEVANRVSLAWVLTANAYPGSDNLRPPDNATYGKDNLIPHYELIDNAFGSPIFFSPGVVTEENRELIPYLSWQESPSSSNSSVFGYANKPLYGSLALSRVNEVNFHQIGIIAQTAGTNNRNQLGNVAENEGKWLASTNGLLVGINFPVNGNHEYRDGIYAFSASVQKEQTDSEIRGYPILFNVLKENSLIVDNDQNGQQPGIALEQTEFNAPSKYYSTVPGYFLSAGLVKGQSDKVSKWNANRRGVFQMKVNIPQIPNATPEATVVRYKIVTKKSDGTLKKIYVTNPINHSQAGWQILTVGSAESKQEHFFLNTTDYISLDLNSAYNEDHWDKVGAENTNMNIPNTSFIAIDAIKFIGGLRQDSNNNSDLVKIRNGLGVTEELAAVVYRNYMTKNPNYIETVQVDETISVEHNSDDNLSKYTLNDLVITISWTNGAVVEGATNTDNGDTNDSTVVDDSTNVESNDPNSDGNDANTDDSNTTSSYLEEVETEILRLAKEYNIPPVIIKSIASKESNWYHLKDGTAKINSEDDGREGIGIMQVTECPPDITCTGYTSISQAEYNLLKDDWKHNLAVGIEKLNSKWNRQNTFVDNNLNAIDKGIIENWYYPVMWYNGEGERAENYVVDAFNRIENSPTHLAEYWDNVTNISDPTTLVVMRNETTGKGDSYELTDLIEKGATIHYWNSTTEEYLYLTSLTEEEYANRENSWPPSDTVKDSPISEEEPESTVIAENTGGIESACSSTLVSEATSGFANPLSDNFRNNGGYSFQTEAKYTKGTVYHPGEDWNVPDSPGGSCNGDKGLNVVATADGVVVYANSTSWGGVVIQHNYNGESWYSQYGHVQNITVSKDNVVTKGQKIAEIGDVETTCAHLHFEIRTSNHPNPCNGPYWSYGENGLYNLSNVESWYEDPDKFIPAHTAYSNTPSITTTLDENGNIQISGTNLEDDGKITVGNKTVEWTADGIIDLNTGITLDNLDKPVRIIGTDSSGNEIFNICYPFIDVCPDTWYAKPIITLWKKGIVNGYSGDWEGYFRPHNPPANRAEFVTATIRALNPNLPLTSVANPSFDDIKGDDWYTPYVEYAKDMGIINGCKTDKFCPNDFITRSAGVKVVVEAFLKGALTRFQLGQQPESIFLDVTDSNKWYYPYIYAAQAEKVINGYSDGYFKPEQNMTRAEMAKVICLAFAIVDEETKQADCADMGETTDRPHIFAVTPEIATLNESTIFEVVGKNLSNTIAFELADCANITAIASGTTEKLLFQCTPSNTSGIKNGTLRYNEGNTVFTVNVSEQIVPKVTSVTPTSATLNQLTTFTIIGSDLPNSLIFEVANCTGINIIETGIERQQFQCTPTISSSQEGVVKDETGAKLKVFYVDVVEPVIETQIDQPIIDEIVDEPVIEEPVVDEPIIEDTVEQPVEEPVDTSCEQSVDSVSPLEATLGELTTFTISGSCLTETTAYWIGRCEERTEVGSRSSTQIQFKCIPSWETGPQDGLVKDKTEGNILKSFTLDVQDCEPEVNSVRPSTANFEELTRFTINGSCLSETTAWWIAHCEEPTDISRSFTQIEFQCIPSWETGPQEGVVKVESGGEVLRDFTVDVY